MTDIAKKNKRGLVWLLLAICLASYVNTIANDFVWDDFLLIAENEKITDYRKIPLFFTPYYWHNLNPVRNSRPSQTQYRPIRTTTFAVDYFFWKLNPAGYHLTNMLLHMANVVLLFYLVSAIAAALEKDDPNITDRYGLLLGLPFLTAALFATHPIHTESVAYIKNRSDLLSFLFFLTAMLLFLRNRMADRRMSRLLLTVGSLFCFFLAVLSKEMALTLPVILVLYAVCFQDYDERRRTVIRVIPFCLMTLLYLWFRQAVLNNTGLPSENFQIDAGRHLLAVIKTIGSYLAFLAFPVKLNAERPFPIPSSVWDPDVILSLGTLALIGFITIKAWRRSKIVLFAIVYVLLTLMPAANIIFLESRPIAEQRLYIPSFGFCLLLAWCIHQMYRREIKGGRSKGTTTVALLSACLLIGGYGVATFQRNKDWRDSVIFYSRTLARNPASARIHNNLGIALAQRGHHHEAMAHYKTALRFLPAFSRAYNNLGVELEWMKKTDEAIWHFERAIQIEPRNAAAHYNLARALSRKGLTEAAIAQFNATIQSDPNYIEAMKNLGVIYLKEDRPEEAVGWFLEALRKKPDYNSALKALGAALIETGNIEEAINRIPVDALSTEQLARVYNVIASIILEQGQAEKAITYYRRALNVDPDCTNALFNLGLALMTREAYQEAAPVFSQLLDLNPRDRKARQRYEYCLKMVAVEAHH